MGLYEKLNQQRLSIVRERLTRIVEHVVMQGGSMADTISEADAERQQERIKAIMAETGKNFDAAVNQYIKEKNKNKISRRL